MANHERGHDHEPPPLSPPPSLQLPHGAQAAVLQLGRQRHLPPNRVLLGGDHLHLLGGGDQAGRRPADHPVGEGAEQEAARVSEGGGGEVEAEEEDAEESGVCAELPVEKAATTTGRYLNLIPIHHKT